eukprot:2382758-Rhodomonas_salina.6
MPSSDRAQGAMYPRACTAMPATDMTHGSVALVRGDQRQGQGVAAAVHRGQRRQTQGPRGYQHHDGAPKSLQPPLPVLVPRTPGDARCD